MTSPLPEQEGSKRRLMYAFELADLIGAKMTPEMMYERWMVLRENPEAAFRSRSTVSEQKERYALPPITKKGRVGTTYTGGMHRGKVARKRKNMKKLRRELPPGEPVSVAVQTPRWWRMPPVGEFVTPACRKETKPTCSRTSRSERKSPIGEKTALRKSRATLDDELPRIPRAYKGSSRGPCGFLGPLKPTCPRIPKDREERKREGTEAMRMPRRLQRRRRANRLTSCRPDFVKMGQQRGKTTSFEDWLKIQREIEAREAEERAATEAALEAAAAEPDLAPQRPRYYCAKRCTVFKKSRSVEGSVDITTRPSVVKLLRTRLWQPHQVDQWSIEKREEPRESPESSSSESSTRSVRVAPRPRMPRRAAGLILSKEPHRWYVRPTYDVLPTVFMDMVTEEESRLRRLAKKYGMSILDVEKVKAELESYDVDGSGTIDKGEFYCFIRNIFGAKDKYDIPEKILEEFWKMLNAGDSGEVTLEQFLAFFWKYFWTRGLDTPGAQISILDCIGRVPTWSEERIMEIAFGNLLQTIARGLEVEDSENEGDKECVEPEPASKKLIRAVLLRILGK